MKGYTTIEAGCVGTPRELKPLVSVVVPTYNAATTLDQALSSLEAQTLTNVEIIVVNDGSTDDSSAIAHAHAAADERIRVIDRENGGYGSACNRGISEARGRWIAILEPDDWVLPKMYETLANAARSYPQPIDIVKSPYWRIMEPDTPEQQHLHCSYQGRVRPRHQPFRISEAPHLLRHHPSIWSALYRRDFLESLAIRFPEYPGAGWADNPFLVETLCQARAILYVDQPFYCYREETPEEHIAFVHRQPLMPLQRWHDMMDVLERLGVEDPVVLGSMVRRGFTYLKGTVDVLGRTPEIDEAAARMFNRMDPTLVAAEAGLAPTERRWYAEAANQKPPEGIPWDYLGSLAQEGLYTLANNGPIYTLKMITSLRK